MGQAATLLKTNITEADQTFYVGQFLEHFKEETALYEHGQAQDNVVIDPNRGTTANWFRYHPLAVVTSASSEGKTTYTAKKLAGMNVTAQVEVWDNVVQVSELMWKAGRDGNMTAGAQLVGQNAGESVERETVKILAETGVWPLSRNAYNVTTGAMLGSFYLDNIVATHTGTTTKFYSTGLLALDDCHTTNNDQLVGAWMCINKGRGYGCGARITSYLTDLGGSAVPGIHVTPAIAEAMTSEVDYVTRITVALHNNNGRILDANDLLNTGILLKAKGILKKNKAKLFEDGTYHCIVDSDLVTQLMSVDTTWKNHMTESRPEKGEMGYIGTWAGISFFEATQLPRYAVAHRTKSAFSTTAGPMRGTFVMGRGAFGKVTIGGENDPELITKPYDSGGVANPTNSYGTMAWKAIWKAKQLNATWCVMIMTYLA